jgi:signal transduction histidine kinase
MHQQMRLWIGTLILIALYAFLQQGPLLLGSIARYPVDFTREVPGKFSADVTNIPKGMYFLSIGRVLGDTQIRMNGVLLQRSKLIAGVPIDLTSDQDTKIVTIECIAKEEWRKRLFDIPIVTSFGTGLLIQEWRIFTGIFMGPVSSLLLILMALFNLKLSKTAASQIMPHLLCGVAGFFYSLYMSGIPDLFFDPVTNSFIRYELRAMLSAALIYLIDAYSGRRHLAILWQHIFCMILLVVVNLVYQKAISEIYELEIVYFCVATLVATLSLLKAKRFSSEIELMFCLGMSWSMAHVLGILSHYLLAIANLTVWTPSFIATLAAANFYLIYRKAVGRSAEIQMTKQQYYLASQIAHDIRSPLAALNAIIHDSSGLSDSTRDQIESVVTRIRGIANSILNKSPKELPLELEEMLGKTGDPKLEAFGLSSEPKTQEFIVPILRSLISEKRLLNTQNEHLKMFLMNDSDEFEFAANIQRIEFIRVISNLINNAVDAVSSRGNVTVSLMGDDHRIHIFVEDTGIGMTPDVLNKIGSRGYSYRKSGNEAGSGLGVYHAMETIKVWGGILKYESELGKGTKAIITLPRVKVPSWFAKYICVVPTATVIVLDDDFSVHDMWRERFRLAGLSSVKILGFVTSRALIQWYRETLGEVNHPLYLCDYELGISDRNGLDVIEMLGVASESILVTHGWDNIEVRTRCLKLGVKIIPKYAHVIVTQSAL